MSGTIEPLEPRQFLSSTLPGVLDTATDTDIGHTYLLLDASNWSDAEAKAVELGGHLVTINSQQENDDISRVFGSTGDNADNPNYFLWLGLTDINSPDDFNWTSGSPSTYSNFFPGEPADDGSGTDHFVVMYTYLDGSPWASYSDDSTFVFNDGSEYPIHGVVEIDNIDTQTPSASLVADPVGPGLNDVSYQFDVNLTDDFGVSADAFGNNNITVTAPGGATLPATFIGMLTDEGPNEVARYSIDEPFGYFDETDNGTYTVNVTTNSLFDNAGHSVPAGPIGAFNVHISPLDDSFGGGDGMVDFDFVAENEVVQPDGKLVVVGHRGDFADAGIVVKRLLPDGSPDPSFSSGNVPGEAFLGVGNINDDCAGFAVALQSDGKIIVTGSGDHNALGDGYTDIATIRLNADGSFDTTFGDGGQIIESFPDNPGETGIGYAVLVRSDDRILVVGSTFPSVDDSFNGTNGASVLFSYLPDGSRDPSFGDNLDGIEEISADDGALDARNVAIGPTGDIVVGGSFLGTGNTDRDFAIQRYTSDGLLINNSFEFIDINGDDSIRAIAVDSQNRVVAVGTSVDADGFSHLSATRSNPDLHLDHSFGGNGTIYLTAGDTSTGNSVVILPNGRIFLSGIVTTNGVSQVLFLRLLDNGNADTSFSTDGTLTLDLPHDISSAATVPPPGLSASTPDLDADFGRFIDKVLSSVKLDQGGGILFMAKNGDKVILGRIDGDGTSPTVDLVALNITDINTTQAVLHVQYSDSGGIKISEISAQDIQIKDPSGQLFAPILLKLTQEDGIRKVQADYGFTRPAGKFTFADNGDYTIYVVPGSLHDLAGSPVAGGQVGKLNVKIAAAAAPGSPVVHKPVISIAGNSVAISNGSTAPAANNFTDFGSLNVASPLAKDFTVANGGDIALDLSAAADVSSSNSAEFQITKQPAASVAAGGNTTFTIRFTPGQPGLRQATITVASNDPAIPSYTFRVQGTGVAVQQPPPDPGSGSVSNTGSDANTGSGSGTGSNPPPSPAALPPAISVTGNGQTIPSGSTAPSTSNSTDFGALMTGTASVVKEFRVANTGDTALALSAPAVTSDNPEFQIIAQPGTSIAGGASSAFQIRFTPAHAGLRQATITIASPSASVAASSFTVAGTAPTAGNDLTITSVAVKGAASVVVGSVAQATVVVKNLSKSPVKGATSLQLFLSSTGRIDAAAQLIKTSPVRLNLAAEATLSVPVTFSFPLVTGTFFVVARLDPDNHIAESLKGNNDAATARPFTVSAPFVDLAATFTKLPAGLGAHAKNRAFSLRVQNLGNSPVNRAVPIKLYASSDSSLDISSDTPLNGVKPLALKLAAKALTTFQGAFSPANLPAGKYFLFAVIDPSNVLSDPSMTNNTAFSNVAIKA